jgi:hypothetical protein
MNLVDTEGKSGSHLAVSSTATTRLTGSWLIIARAVWLALVVPSLGLFVVGLPIYYQQVQRSCVDPVTCSLGGAQTAKGLQDLSAHGLSVSEYAALFTIFFAIMAATWCAVGFLLFWRRSDDWLALLAAFFLVITGITLSNNSLYVLALTSPILALPLGLVYFLGSASLFVFFLLFPNGRLVPRWMGLILLLGFIYAFLDNLPSRESPLDTNWPGWLYVLENLVLYGAIIFSQIYRYRRVSTPVQRQQTKWVIFGGTVTLGVLIGLLVMSFVVVSFVPSLNNTLFFTEVWAILPIAALLIPLSIGFSILRYRLYDIDLLINRTLVYGMLTISLALIYVGLVIGLGSLVRLFTGQLSQSPVVIVASTLAIAALFQPLRHRTQTIIDHRFYRRKYDAAKTLEAFSATLRNEVDLTQLSEHLITVVQETMQPSHVSLWLRKPEKDTHSNAWEASRLSASHEPILPPLNQQKDHISQRFS